MGLGLFIPSGAILVPPAASGGDSGPAIQAANARGPVQLVAGASYTITTTANLVGRIYLNGATITSKVASNGGTSAPFMALPVNVGSALVLAGDTTVGNLTFTLTTQTNVVAGAWIALSHSTKEYGQFFKVVSVSGVSNPFTVTVDRPLSFVYPASGGVAQVVVPPIGVEIHGQGATIAADAAAARDRAIEIQGVDVLVEDVAITGRFLVGASFDIGTLRGGMRRVVVTGDGTHTTVGVASENNESSSLTDLFITGIAAGGSNACLFAYGGRGNTYTRIRGTDSPGAYGAALDVDGGASGEPGSDGCVLSDSTFDKCTVGVILANAATNWTISSVTASWSTTDGFQVATLTSGVPSNNRLVNVVADHNGNDGILAAAGSNTTITGARITSNYLHGVEITGATGMVIRDGSIESNGTSGTGYGIVANTTSSTLIDGARFFNSITGGIDAISSGTVTVRGCTFVSDLGTAWSGIFLAGTNNLRVTDSNFTLSGAGILAAIQVSGGTTYARNNRATGSGTSYGWFRNSGTFYEDPQTNDLSGTANPRTGTLTAPVVTVDVGPLVAGTKTTASGYTLTNATVVGVWTVTAGGTQVGVPTVTFSTNSLVVTGGTLDTSTYRVALSGAR